MTHQEWIEGFAKSSYQLWKGHDPASHLPFNIFGLYPYYSDLWIERVYNAIRKIRETGKSMEEVTKAMPNPSSCRFVFLILVMHMKNAKFTDKEKIKTICDFFVDVLEIKTKGKDIFAHDTNLAHAKEEISQVLKETEWESGGIDAARALGKLNVGMATLVHSLYNDWMTDYSYEISGPYDASERFDGKHIMLIRDFEDMKPLDVWPESNDFKYKNIRVLTVYKDLDCKIAYVGCHSTYSGNLPEHLSHYAIFADGKQIKGQDALREVALYFMGIAQGLFAKYSSIGFEEQKRKYFVQEAYQIRGLFESAGEDWKPPKEFFDRVAGKPLLQSPWMNYNLSFEDYCEQFGINNLKLAYE